jgi:hypothetical protein
MGKNAIYGWIGLAVLFVILWQANKRKEESAGAYGDYMRSRVRGRSRVNTTMGSRKPKYPCYCNGHWVGNMTHADCVEKCAVQKGMVAPYRVTRLPGRVKR